LCLNQTATPGFAFASHRSPCRKLL